LPWRATAARPSYWIENPTWANWDRLLDWERIGDPPALAANAGHQAALGLGQEVLRQDAVRFLARAEGTFDLVFCDPPYDSASRLAGPLAERLPAITVRGARIVTESDKRNPLELPFPLITERTYGDTRIAIHGG
jgi:16S rRNA G966 N2-methylase RsmD